MNKKQIKCIKDYYFGILESSDILDVAKHSEDLQEFEDKVRDGQYLDQECIYYSRAMEYLSENDSSLTESLGIASEYGYSLENLNSEVLASLLMTRDAEEEFYELLKELEDLE